MQVQTKYIYIYALAAVYFCSKMCFANLFNLYFSHFPAHFSYDIFNELVLKMVTYKYSYFYTNLIIQELCLIFQSFIIFRCIDEYKSACMAIPLAGNR